MRHAAEITSMSIDLVEACETFIIPHKPKEPLKIRVGLHSGNCENVYFEMYLHKSTTMLLQLRAI